MGTEALPHASKNVDVKYDPFVFDRTSWPMKNPEAFAGIDEGSFYSDSFESNRS
jgi:hypothetical protein